MNSDQRARVQQYVKWLYERWRELYPNSPTQGDFARAAGIHDTMLSDYLRGEAVPTSISLLALMDAVGATEAGPDQEKVMDAARALLRRLSQELRDQE